MHRLADQLRWLLGQKRRWLYSAAAVAIVGLAAGVPLVLARDDRCARGEERLAGIWDRPAVAATVGDRTTQKLVAYAHEWVDGYRRVCEATHVRGDQSESLLDLRMRCLDDRRRALGALATVLTTRADATTQANAVSAAGSLPAIADCDALETLVEILPPPATARAQVDALTPRLDEAEALERAGHFADSLTLAEKVAADAQPLGYRALDARVALLVGDLQQQLGDPKAAEAALHRAAQAAAEARDDVAAAKAWTLLVGVVGYLGGRPDEGLALARFADAAVARANAADSVGADLDSMRGLVYDALGQYDEARRHHERALATRERTLGPDHLEVAQVLDNLGAIPLEQRRWDEAEKHYARALDIRRRQLGEDHPDVGASWNSLGAAQRGKGARETALASYEKAHRIWQRSLGPDHPNLAAALNNIGNLERELGRPRPAREHLRAALELWRRVSPVEHAASIAIVVSNLGLLAHEANDLEGAEALLAEALPLLEAALGKEHPRLTVTLHNLAEVKRERGDCAAAEPLFRRALALREAKLGKDHVDVADPLVGLGQCRLAAGDAPGALPLLERAVLLRRTSSDAKENATAEAELQRARILAGKR
jgi:tetratricopeptide (TPR) repeat protein